jgi:hypothetical protein
MKKVHFRLFGWALGVVVMLAIVFRVATIPSLTVVKNQGSKTALPNSTDNSSVDKAKQSLAKLPMSFELNKGQTDPQVKFMARGSGYSAFLTEDGAVLSLKASKKSAVMRTHLVGANRNPKIVGEKPLPGKSNYLLGNDRSKWVTDIPTFAKIRYQDVYPGIDEIYQGDQGNLRYDFVVKPGASPSSIQLTFDGAEKISVKDGNLVLQMAGKGLVHKKPYTYQEIAGVRQEVASNFALKNGRVTFDVGRYNTSEPLIIDPTVVFSTWLGGDFTDAVNGIVINTTTNPGIYVVGTTNSTTFVKVGGVSGQIGANDVFVSKLNGSGTTMIYSTYLGGTSNDYGNGIALASDGSVVVVGQTYSTNFTSASNAGPTGQGTDTNAAFALKLNAAGGAVTWSKYINGPGNEFATSVALDASNNAYVVGYTDSASFNPQGAATPLTNAGASDIFVVGMSSAAGAITSQALFGGANAESPSPTSSPLANPAFGGPYIALDGVVTTAGTSGDVWIGGFTLSSTLPAAINAGPSQANTSCGGGPCPAGFVARLPIATSGTNLLSAGANFSMFYNGSAATDSTFITGVRADANGRAYFTGYSTSVTLPGMICAATTPVTIPGSFQVPTTAPASCSPAQGPALGATNAFVGIVDPSLVNPIVYATYYGGANTNTFAYGLAIDNSPVSALGTTAATAQFAQVYITGKTFITSGTNALPMPTAAQTGLNPVFVNPINTTPGNGPGPFRQDGNTGANAVNDPDAFVARFNPNGAFASPNISQLNVGSFMYVSKGTSAADIGQAIAVAPSNDRTLAIGGQTGDPNVASGSGTAASWATGGPLYSPGGNNGAQANGRGGAYGGGASDGFIASLAINDIEVVNTLSGAPAANTAAFSYSDADGAPSSAGIGCNIMTLQGNVLKEVGSLTGQAACPVQTFSVLAGGAVTGNFTVPVNQAGISYSPIPWGGTPPPVPAQDWLAIPTVNIVTGTVTVTINPAAAALLPEGTYTATFNVTSTAAGGVPVADNQATQIVTTLVKKPSIWFSAQIIDPSIFADQPATGLGLFPPANYTALPSPATTFNYTVNLGNPDSSAGSSSINLHTEDFLALNPNVSTNLSGGNVTLSATYTGCPAISGGVCPSTQINWLEVAIPGVNSSNPQVLTAGTPLAPIPIPVNGNGTLCSAGATPTLPLTCTTTIDSAGTADNGPGTSAIPFNWTWSTLPATDNLPPGVYTATVTATESDTVTVVGPGQSVNGIPQTYATRPSKSSPQSFTVTLNVVDNSQRIQLTPNNAPTVYNGNTVNLFANVANAQSVGAPTYPGFTTSASDLVLWSLDPGILTNCVQTAAIPSNASGTLTLPQGGSPTGGPSSQLLFTAPANIAATKTINVYACRPNPAVGTPVTTPSVAQIPFVLTPPALTVSATPTTINAGGKTSTITIAPTGTLGTLLSGLSYVLTLSPSGFGSLGAVSIDAFGNGTVVYTPPATASVSTAVTVTVGITSLPGLPTVNSPAITVLPASNVSITPTTATLYGGGTQQFVATAANAPGVTPTYAAAPAATFACPAAAVGTVSTTGIYVAPAAANIPATGCNVTVTTTLAALDGTRTATATVTELPATAISIAPVGTIPALVYAGQTVSFNVTSTTPTTPSPSTTGTPLPLTVTLASSGVGSVSPTSCITPCTVTYTAPATIASSASVTVNGSAVAPDGSKNAASAAIPLSPASSITISPAAVTLGNGGTQQFSSVQANVDVTKAVTWNAPTSATCAAVGSMSATGLYTAPGNIVASCTVSATASITALDGTKTSNTATITLNPQGVVTVSPASASLVGGGTQQFSAVASDKVGATFTWTISPAGTGSISATGLYTAPATVTTSTAVTVTATTVDPVLGTRTGTAIVTLYPPISVTVSPTSVNPVYPSGTQQFTATVLNAFSNSNVTWSVSGSGTISTSGLYTAPATITTGSTATVTATSVQDTTKSASATVTLSPAITATISPASVSLGGGGTQTFTCAVANTTNTTVTYTLTGAGTINATSGLYTAPASIPTAASATVTCVSSANTSATSPATISLVPLAISVTPGTAVVYAGQTQPFTATVSQNTNTAVTWSVFSGPGTISTSGVYSAPASVAAGTTAIVMATSVADTTKTATASVSLQPASSITITPPTTATLYSGQAASFTAITSPVGGTVTWTLTGLGSLTGGGTTFICASPAVSCPVTYTAPASVATNATATLTATYNAADGVRTATATISLLAPSSVTVAPATASLRGSQTQQFTSTTTNPSGGSVTYSIASATCPAGAFGSITAAGLYTAPANITAACAVTVTSTFVAPDATRTATATVSLLAPGIVTVTPASASLYGGGTQLFTASASDSSTATFTFAISPAGTGSISAAGLYTAPATVTASTTVTVTATTVDPLLGQRVGSAVVTLYPPIQVLVSPSSVANPIYPNGTQQFTATVLNASTNSNVTWSVSPAGSGTISATGLYTAPSSITTGSTVTVTATSVQASTVSASATLTLSPPITVTVSPGTVSVSPGNTQQFTATLANTTNSNVTWSILGGGPGTISASGLYTPPTVNATLTNVTVVATSVADPTKSGQGLIALQVDNLSYDNNTNFVSELYCGFLSRGSTTATFLVPPCTNAVGPIDSSGLTYWVGQITTLGGGPSARAQVALNFFNSPEFQTDAALAIDAYITALNRDPDYAGFTYWTNQLKQGVTQLTMLNTFITSAEFTAIYGSTTNTQFVTLVYQNVLNRAPDTNGLNYWVGQLNGGVSRGSVLQSFANGAEYQTLSNNRTIADIAYLGLLRRTPDVAGRQFWTDELNLGISPLALLQAFITSAEFIGDFQ